MTARQTQRFVMRLAAIPLVLLIAACRTVSMPAAVQGGVTAPHPQPPRPGAGTVVGVVADSASGYPVVGASIFFTRDSVIGVSTPRPRTDLPRATTDNGGGFVLRDVPPGEYTLAFSDLDHFPIRTVVVVRSDQVHSVVMRPRRRLTP